MHHPEMRSEAPYVTVLSVRHSISSQLPRFLITELLNATRIRRSPAKLLPGNINQNNAHPATPTKTSFYPILFFPIKRRLAEPENGGFVGASGDDALAIGGDRDGVDRTAMSFQLLEFLARLCIPDPSGVVITSGDDALAIGREGYGSDITAMSFQPLEFLARLCIPDPCRVIGASGDDALAINGDRDSVDSIAMSFQPLEFLACLCIPDPSRVVGATGDDASAIGGEGD